jgi:hypothetical protein
LPSWLPMAASGGLSLAWSSWSYRFADDRPKNLLFLGRTRPRA